MRNLSRLEGQQLLLEVGLLLLVGELDSLPLLGISGLAPGLLLVLGVLANGLVHGGVEVSKVIGLDALGDVGREVLVVLLGLLIAHLAHVLGNVLTHDVLLQDLGVELLALLVVTSETLLVVGNIHATVAGTLEGGEHLGTSGGTLDANIEESLEGASALTSLNVVVLTGHLLLAHVLLVEAELLEGAASDQETHAVSGSVVGQTNLEAVLGQLMRVGSALNNVTRDRGADDLHADVLVREADSQPVLGKAILVLVLGHKPLASPVVGLSRATAPVLDLVTLEVLRGLEVLDVRHGDLEVGGGSCLQA
mmetsp:Transcript_30717/g.67082  ORF Transcript_30717/g.67082 Transcript_30717/m.67082 type:complete len:308 (+) Transcript_30717:105-1028(+)